MVTTSTLSDSWTTLIWRGSLRNSPARLFFLLNVVGTTLLRLHAIKIDVAIPTMLCRCSWLVPLSGVEEIGLNQCGSRPTLFVRRWTAHFYVQVLSSRAYTPKISSLKIETFLPPTVDVSLSPHLMKYGRGGRLKSPAYAPSRSVMSTLNRLSCCNA